MKEIDKLVGEMQALLAEDKDIDGLIADFVEISASFGKTTKIGIHGASGIAKALKGGNKVVNIPLGLEAYKEYIRSDVNYKWVKWQLDGNGYIEMTTNCPYCTSDIQEKKPTIKRVSEVYESKSIENLNKIVSVFQRLGDYFSVQAREIITEFVQNVDGYSDEQTDFLREVNTQVDNLAKKFVQAKSMGFSSFKDVDKVIEVLSKFKIDLNLYVHLNSEKTNEKVKIVNGSFDVLIKKAGELQGKINKQKSLIEKLVQENSKGINGFLGNAGYHYKVVLSEDKSGLHKLKLIHKEAKDQLENVKSHLSFGERNAFALILFMYDALRDKPDLVILDDPISSFDKNKKYAIVDMIFQGGRSFRDKTVLLLTHDFDPIVDMILHHYDRFAKSHAAFLENKKGILTEIGIKRGNIKTFIEINNENLQTEMPQINKMVYLRRLFELMNSKGLGYNLISNLLHKRVVPNIKDGEIIRDMTKMRFMMAH